MHSRLLVLAAAVLWSTSGACIKSTGLPAMQVAAGRSFFAAIFFALLLPQARRGWDRRTFLVGVAYAVTTVLFVLANKKTTAANAIFLQDTAPFWVLLLAPWILGEKPTRGELLSAPVYLLGIGLFFLDELSSGERAGNVLALISGVSFAFLIVWMRRMRDGGAEAAILAGNLMGLAVAAPSFFLEPAPVRTIDVGILVFLGTFQLGLAYLCFLRGLRGVSALEGALLALFEPVLNPIWTYLVAGEQPKPWALAGASLVLLATVGRLVAPARAKNPAAAGNLTRGVAAD